MLASMTYGGLCARIGLSLLLLAALPATTRAQEENEPDLTNEQARALFLAGRAAFEAANYEDALRHFRDSYELSGRAGLLYNIGVAADRLRRDAEALDALERYLAEAPTDARQRADAEARVRVLREQVARAASTDNATPEPGSTGGADTGSAPTSTAEEPVAGWALLGSGVAVLVAGAVFLGVGQAEASAVEGAPEGTPYLDVAGAADNANWMRVLGWVLAGVGLATGGVGLTLALTAPRGGGETVLLRVGPSFASLSW